MSRKVKHGRGKVRNGKSGPLSVRDHLRLTPAQQEAAVRTFFTIGTVSGTARALGVSEKAVRNALRELQNDPALLAARGQALDEMAGKIHAVTDKVIASITPEELITTRRDVRDTHGNLIRTVIDGPSLKDKALTIGILADKQKTLAEAKARATDGSTFQQSQSNLMLPDNIADKERLVASMVKRLRITDVFFHDTDVQQNVKGMLNRVGIREEDIEDADLELSEGLAPFD